MIMFTEQQRFRQKWVWILILGSSLVAWWSFVQQIMLRTPFGDRPSSDIVVWIIWILFGMGMPWLFISLKLITQVRSDGLHVRFSPFRERIIRFGDIASYSVRQYNPLREYGGWGIRWTKKNGMAYNVSGNMGVQLELADNKKILIGSQKADELAASLRQMMGR
jgi:hypothetical protein